MTTMKKAILLFGLLSLIICNDITAQNIVNNDSIKNSKADNLKTAEDYFERANIITKTKMFSLDSTTASKT
jgi:hypothetical protein